MSELIKAIQEGIALDNLEPFKKISETLGISEDEVIQSIKDLKANKSIKRFGPVLKNREVGFKQNAMTTLKVLPENVVKLGEKISSFDFVTLCYERDIISGVWEYNLYFMIHGKERVVVEDQIQQVINAIKTDLIDYKILFSSHCFKQKGASY